MAGAEALLAAIDTVRRYTEGAVAALVAVAANHIWLALTAKLCASSCALLVAPLAIVNEWI